MSLSIKLAPQSLALEFSDEKMALIQKTYGKDLTPLEFELFMSVAKSRGLDPVMSQIHAVKRRDGESSEKRLTIQVAIDGYRLIAERTGAYAGKDKTVFIYDKDNKTYPKTAEVTVYKIVQGQRVAFTETANWSEYFPGDRMGFMWKKMPETMLGKCAEAKALRSAFPNDLSGLFVPEEIQQERGPHVMAEKLVAASKRFEAPETPNLPEADSQGEGIVAVKIGVKDVEKRQRLKDMGFKWSVEKKHWFRDYDESLDLEDLEHEFI